MEALLLLLIPLVLLLSLWPASSQSRRIDRLARQLRVIERRTQLIMDHLGIVEPGPTVPEAVTRHLDAGRKIDAIKAYREATGASLKEAKDAVEALVNR